MNRRIPFFLILFIFISLIFALVFLSGCINNGLNYEKVEVSFNTSSVSVLAEKADTDVKIQQGLMWRESLGEKEGMFFDMGSRAYHFFWMANTKIPLEGIFIDENFVITDISEMAPCDKKPPDPCPTYNSRFPIRYFLEVNQNFSKKYGIKEGDFVIVN